MDKSNLKGSIFDKKIYSNYPDYYLLFRNEQDHAFAVEKELKDIAKNLRTPQAQNIVLSVLKEVHQWKNELKDEQIRFIPK